MWPLSRRASVIRRRSSTSGSARNLLSLEVLEDRRMMAALPIGSVRTVTPPRVDPIVAWVDQNIQDAHLRSLVKQLDADRVLSRTDMMAILDQAAVGGVTAFEFADLKDLVSRPDLLGTPDYVQNLANKVVNGDQANAHFQGEALGNLAAGSSKLKLNLLTSKWFLGADRPAIPTNSQLDLAENEYIAYRRVAGELFHNDEPTYADIDQGSLGDCSYMAALEETVRQRPSLIKEMFINNGDDTFTVRFFNGDTPDYVTVDRHLPVSSTTDKLVLANATDAAYEVSNVLWAALAEKAYAQINESGWAGGHGDANAYWALDSLWPERPLEELTGMTFVNFGLHQGAATIMGAAIGIDFQAGKLVTFTSDDSGVNWNIVPNHVYAMLEYNAVTGRFTLGNPHGPDASANNQSIQEITVSATTLFENFSKCTMNNPGQMVTTLDTILHTQQIPPLYDAYITDFVSSIIRCGPLDPQHLTATSYLNSIQGLAGARTAIFALAGATPPRAVQEYAASSATQASLSLPAASQLGSATGESKDAALAAFADPLLLAHDASPYLSLFRRGALSMDRPSTFLRDTVAADEPVDDVFAELEHVAL
jgi:hypothetical protein